jgi:hypothetical protein
MPIMNNWLARTIRRFAVVFVSGGIVAITEELNIIQFGASPDVIIYIAAITGLLSAIDKAIRDHKSLPITSK